MFAFTFEHAGATLPDDDLIWSAPARVIPCLSNGRRRFCLGIVNSYVPEPKAPPRILKTSNQ
jgi:hypothetical protein